MEKSKLPDKIRKKLEKKGFFQLTPEELQAINQQSFGKLFRSSKGDPDGERDALRESRGDYR